MAARRWARASDDPARTVTIRLEGQAGLLPGRHAALEVLDGVAEGAQPARRGVAPVPVAAHRDDRALLRDLPDPSAKLAEGDVLRPRDVPGRPLVRLADVQEMQVRPAARLFRLHGPNSASVRRPM